MRRGSNGFHSTQEMCLASARTDSLLSRDSVSSVKMTFRSRWKRKERFLEVRTDFFQSCWTKERSVVMKKEPPE